MAVDVFKRCGCRDPESKKRLEKSCPRLAKRGHGTWYFECMVSTLAGRPERARRGGFPTKSAATAARNALLSRSREESTTVLWTVTKWLRYWISTRTSIRPSTLRSYTEHVDNVLIPHLGSVRLGELTGRQVAAMFTTLATTPNKWGRPPSPSTLHRIRATLRSALNAAIREGLIRDNPARFIELPSPRRPQAQVWTDHRIREWQRTGQRYSVAVWTAKLLAEFLRFVAQDRLYAMWWLIALRGLRRGEAAGLRWIDVDLDEQVIMISQQRITFGHTTTVGPPKTAASRRTIALDKTTVGVLRAHRQLQMREAAKAGETWVDSGYVFTDPHGRPLNPDYLTRRFRYLVGQSGLPPVRLHDLRHGAATLAHAAGADPKTVQEQLGHTSIVLTADTYTSVLMILHFKIAEATARLVLAAASKNPGHRYHQRKTGPPTSAASPAPTRPEPLRPKRSRKQKARKKARTHVTPNRHPKIK
jgi:integrase